MVATIDSSVAYDHYAFRRGFGTQNRGIGNWDSAENNGNPYGDEPTGFHGTRGAVNSGKLTLKFNGCSHTGLQTRLSVNDF